VQEQHAALDAVARRGALHGIDEMVERPVEAKHRVAAIVVGIVEEAVVSMFLPAVFVHLEPVRQDHVVKPLISRPGDFRMLADNVKVLGERTDPVLASELFAILTLGYKGYDIASVAHLVLSRERLRPGRLTVRST